MGMTNGEQRTGNGERGTETETGTRNGEWGTGNGEQGTGNGESLKAGIFKSGNFQKRESLKEVKRG